MTTFHDIEKDYSESRKLIVKIVKERSLNRWAYYVGTAEGIKVNIVMNEETELFFKKEYHDYYFICERLFSSGGEFYYKPLVETTRDEWVKQLEYQCKDNM